MILEMQEAIICVTVFKETEPSTRLKPPVYFSQILIANIYKIVFLIFIRKSLSYFNHADFLPLR